MNTLSHNGFTAWISSNGANLCVYNVKIDTTNPKEISCWIASDPDTVSFFILPSLILESNLLTRLTRCYSPLVLLGEKMTRGKLPRLVISC